MSRKVGWRRCQELLLIVPLVRKLYMDKLQDERPIRVLIITEYVAPVRAVASLRWSGIGKYLARLPGVEMSVLTIAKTYGGVCSNAEYDKNALSDLGQFLLYLRN